METAGVVAVEGVGQKKQRRRELIALRTANMAAWDRAGPQEGLGKLDPSLKRHTALLVRLRSSLHTPAGVPSLLKDIASLALEKYVEEAVGAVLEGLTKCKSGAEILGAVEVTSAIHVRFPDLFTRPFTALLLQALKPATSSATDKDIKEKEDSARIIRQRGLMKILGELELVGVVRKDAKSAGTTGDVTFATLKDLLIADKEALPLVAPLAIAFAKYLGPFYLPPPPSSSATDLPTTSQAQAHDFPTLAESAEGVENDLIVGRDTKDKFRKLLGMYLDALGKRESKNHMDLQRQDRRNHEAYIRSGEVFEDREKTYEKSVRAWEKGWASVTTLSELLGVPVPSLPSLTSTLTTTILGTTGSSFTVGNGEEIGGPGSLWLDEEDKRFYEELRDLRGEVPASILGVAKEAKDGDADEEGKRTEGNGEEELVPLEEEAVPEDGTADLENPMEALALDLPDPTLPAGPAAQLTALLARLPDASSITSIDAIAIEFAFLNSKAARKRLVRTLGSVHRNRQDILPYYARLVGTLNVYMSDIGKDLIALLEEEFRYLQRKKAADMAETRSKNLRFFSELTKFRVTPVHSIFHIFKVLLDDFSGPNIDNLCTVLEGCGRYLLRTESTSERMKVVLETLKRKKAAMHLDQMQVTMLENAYYQCDPPDRPIVAPKERTPMQLYLRHLFYNVLTRNASDKVLKIVRKLHWEDLAIVQKLHSAFTKVWKIKYSNVHLFAVLLHDLSKYHPDFTIDVIDEVLENVRVGMEINSFKYNQQRVATIKYLGELYNYRVVDSRVIFDTLWSLVTFGHPEGRPWPDVPSPVDPVDDYFRIRLVCTLLDTCGTCFERGALKKKLDNYLVFFQMYILSKGILPMDVDFMVSDTFELLRPKLVFFKSFGDAALAVDEMMAAVAKNGPAEEEPEELDLLDTEASRRAEEADGDESEGSSTEDEEDSDTTIRSDGDASEDESAHRGKDPNAITQEEEDEFNRELAKMMVSTETRKAPERKMMDVGVPIVKRQQQSYREETEEGPAPGGGMKFTLLTKKGNRQQTLSMEIPRESAIAVHTLEKRAQDKAEQQQLKRHILDYEQREEASEKQALQDTLARRGVTLKFAPPKPSG